MDLRTVKQRNHETELTIMAAQEYQYNEESKSIQLLNVAPMTGDHVPAARVAGLMVAENLARILQRRLDRHQRRRCKPHDHKTSTEFSGRNQEESVWAQDLSLL
jgi:hypothetical protein